MAASARPPIAPAGPLRPLLKLRHLPDRALPTVRRVLDEDELFRSVVAAATTEELVGAASWLYLQRPGGWEEQLAEAAEAQQEAAAASQGARAEAQAARRLAVVEESLRRAEAEVRAVRAELADVKERLAEERKARRAADTEAGRLRRRLADLQGAEGPDDRAALMAEVMRLEAALAATPSLPVAPVVQPDPAPVRRALEALDRVRDELGGWLVDEPVPAGAPRRRPTPLPPAVFDDTVQAADHLVRVPGVVVLVDGYNLTKLRFPDLALPDQRAWLLDALGALAARCDAELHVVFDGEAASAPAAGPRRASVHVRFTGAGVEADDELLALAAAIPAHRAVVVVSDDRRVRDGAAALGANVVGSGTFADLLRR